MRVYYDRDADLNLIKSKNVVIVGYGSQGRAHALNLKDSGAANVAIALKAGSPTIKKAEADGFKVMTVADAAKWGDLIMMATPDELQADIYKADIAGNIRDGAAIAFAHGLNVHFGLIEPKASLDVVMIAPKGPGHTVRGEYQKGGGVPCLVAVHQNASGNALEDVVLFKRDRDPVHRNISKQDDKGKPRYQKQIHIEIFHNQLPGFGTPSFPWGDTRPLC